MTRGSGNAIPGGLSRERLSPRDRTLIELVGRFRLMTRAQIGAVLFVTQASKTPLDRSLQRLTAGGYLARLARFVGGDAGGSEQYVYQLGRVGWRLIGGGHAYRPLRSVSQHTLMITECFVALHRLEQMGRLSVVTFEPEPGCHRQVAGVTLTPDAYVEVGLRERQRKYALWLEIDRDTEHAETIKGKCVRYWRAYQHWEGDVFPYVVFVVPDARRAQEIKRVIATGPANAQALFWVLTLDSVAEDIHRNVALTAVNVIDQQG